MLYYTCGADEGNRALRNARHVIGRRAPPGFSSRWPAQRMHSRVNTSRFLEYTIPGHVDIRSINSLVFGVRCVQE